MDKIPLHTLDRLDSLTLEDVDHAHTRENNITHGIKPKISLNIKGKDSAVDALLRPSLEFADAIKHVTTHGGA